MTSTIRTASFLSAVLAALAIPAQATTSADAPVHACDRLAGAVGDPALPKGVKGVDVAKVNIKAARKACADALTYDPMVARFHFQMGRTFSIETGGKLKEELIKVSHEHFERAAQLGSAAAKNALGADYAEGFGVPKDEVKARRLHSEAAEAGFPFAMADLAVMMREGRGGPVDLDGALKWAEKSGAGGYDGGWSIAATIYETRGNLPAAVAAYRKGVAAGDGVAMVKLAEYLKAGTGGVARDDVEAKRLMKKAKQLGVTH